MNGMDSFSIVENPFRKSGFAGIDMRAYADIANLCIICLHFKTPSNNCVNISLFITSGRKYLIQPQRLINYFFLITDASDFTWLVFRNFHPNRYASRHRPALTPREETRVAVYIR
jgi:hypothetical protein